MWPHLVQSSKCCRWRGVSNEKIHLQSFPQPRLTTTYASEFNAGATLHPILSRPKHATLFLASRPTARKFHLISLEPSYISNDAAATMKHECRQTPSALRTLKPLLPTILTILFQPKSSYSNLKMSTVHHQPYHNPFPFKPLTATSFQTSE